jgi:hypothetical protein
MAITSVAQDALHSDNAALEFASYQLNPQKESPAQQLIRQAVENLQQQLQAGKSEALIAYWAGDGADVLGLHPDVCRRRCAADRESRGDPARICTDPQRIARRRLRQNRINQQGQGLRDAHL